MARRYADFLISNGLQYSEYMIPHHLYGRYQHALVWRVYATHCGAYADHVHTGELLAEQSAFKSCMYASDEGFLVEQAPVLLYGYDEELAVGVHLPPWIALARIDVCTCQLEHGTESICYIVACRKDAAAL